MEAKEKAKELYNKFFVVTPQPYVETEIKEGHYAGLKFQDWDKDWTHNMAKKCALIAVDLILKDKHGCNCEQSVVVNGLHYTYLTYWHNVKIEISEI